MRILLVYATVEGQTRKIATHVAERLSGSGHDITLIDATNAKAAPAADSFDASILLAPVHVGTFDDRSGYGDEFLSGIAASHHLVPVRKRDMIAAAEAMAKGQPVSLAAFANDRLHEWVAQVLHYRPIDAIYVFSGQMAQYVPPHFPGRVVLDLCDVDSAKFEAYADAGQRRWINRREGRLLATAGQFVW